MVSAGLSRKIRLALTSMSSDKGVSGVSKVFDPPGTPDRMSEAAQVAVGWY
jgi:metal-sulfur cluster biosynthetic enzyme